MKKNNYFILLNSSMHKKDEIKTFPECFQLENSDIELKTTLKAKKTTLANNKNFSDNAFYPECIFTDEDKNILFYESDSKSSYKERKNHSLNKKSLYRSYDCEIPNRKNSSKTNYVTEQFSYNYMNNEENIKKENNKRINKNNTFINGRIPSDTFLNHRNNNQFPKRTIKTYQNKFDVEKSDNFNVLSYKQGDYDSDYIKTDTKSKFGKILKKEEVKDIFYPNKRAQTPLSLPLYNNSSYTKKQLLSHQTPTLKFQSYFESYTNPKQERNKSQVKSTSKIKNHLEDFNIDKLIEIGDNFPNKWKSILSFGKKINNLKNKNKKNLNYNNNEKNKINTANIKQIIDNNQSEKKNVNKIKIFPKNTQIEENVKNNNDNNDNNNDNKIIRKKIVYHGKIKRKKNIKNNKAINKFNKNINNLNKINEDINKNINTNNKIKELNMNNNCDNDIDNNIDNDIDNNIDNNNIDNNMDNNINNNINNNSNTANSKKFKKKNKIVNSENREDFDNKNKEWPIYQQITPRKPPQKKKININLNNNNNSNILENKNYINNNMINKEDIAKNESQIIQLTEENNNSSEKIINQQFKTTIRKPKIKSSNKKYNRIKPIINNNPNSFKRKNNFGDEERNNLKESNNNNHSYYVSVYSRKKINQKKGNIDKIN